MRNPFKRKTSRYPYGIPRVFGGREWTYFGIPNEVLDWPDKALPNTTTVVTVTGGPVPPGSTVTVEFDPPLSTGREHG